MKRLLLFSWILDHFDPIGWYDPFQQLNFLLSSGDADSSVYGSVIAGVFQGQLTTGDGEVFYVDRKQYHPKHPLTSGDLVHSVIYKKDDVDVEKFYEWVFCR